MNLLRAEWRRLFARRFLTIMLLIVVAIMSLVGLGVALSSQPPGPAANARAHAEAERARDDIRQIRDRCIAAQDNPDQAGGGQPEFPPGTDCEAQFDLSQVRDEDYLPTAFSFRRDAHGLVLVFGSLFTLLAFAVGASFIGAEWASGGMMNLLTWRPNRLAVLGTKLLALVTGLVGVGVILGAAWLGAVYLISRLRGNPGRITDGLLISLALDNARALGLALAAGAVGFALASLGRHTATALGIAVAYLLVLEAGLQIVLRIMEVTKVERWFLSTYAVAWLEKKINLYDVTACRPGESECQAAQWSLDMADSAIVFGSAVAVVLVLAFVVMRRRDVT